MYGCFCRKKVFQCPSLERIPWPIQQHEQWCPLFTYITFIVRLCRARIMQGQRGTEAAGVTKPVLSSSPLHCDILIRVSAQLYQLPPVAPLAPATCRSLQSCFCPYVPCAWALHSLNSWPFTLNHTYPSQLPNPDTQLGFLRARAG